MASLDQIGFDTSWNHIIVDITSIYLASFPGHIPGHMGMKQKKTALEVSLQREIKMCLLIQWLWRLVDDWLLKPRALNLIHAGDTDFPFSSIFTSFVAEKLIASPTPLDTDHMPWQPTNYKLKKIQNNNLSSRLQLVQRLPVF